jgi:hypothetical protein
LTGIQKHESPWLLRVIILLNNVNIADKRKVMINEAGDVALATYFFQEADFLVQE